MFFGGEALTVNIESFFQCDDDDFKSKVAIKYLLFNDSRRKVLLL